jgi:S-adenosylmethionine:tRNA ribosyltransferase-isomerase
VQLDELQYNLPPELIAQRPAEPRDAARLLVLWRKTGRIEHRHFRDLGAYLAPGDALVLNNTRVIPARFFCRRTTGGRVEALFLREQDNLWHVLLRPSAKLRPGAVLRCEGTDTELELCDRADRGEWLTRPRPPVTPIDLLSRIGQTPLPPYIRPDTAGRHGAPDESDRERYQTVYATELGAVAAPTAGLHFTPAMLAELTAAGVRRADVTLHVGLGTFAPIVENELARHRMHAEWFEAPTAALETLREVRAADRRIIAIGTTAVRVLESLADLGQSPASGWTNLFIYPPYAFRHVDCMVTNFHLPGSTLLALVMALASPELIRAAYQAAIAERYRFYSYGDAMLIL